jgi:hypothetical protein
LDHKTVNAYQTGERSHERADAKPEQHEAGREDLGNDEYRAQHSPQDPNPLRH